MQYEKCCYCEQKIPFEGHSKAVEHFKPKSTFRYLRNDWDNLLLACPQCNGKKSDKFPIELTDDSGETKVIYNQTESDAEPLIIDPSDSPIDPEEHIDFIVDDMDDQLGLTITRNNSMLGEITIDVVGLYRKFYTNENKEYYFILLDRYTTLLSAKHQNNNESIENSKERFKMMMSAKRKYAAFVRAFARYKQLDRRFGISIPVGAET